MLEENQEYTVEAYFPFIVKTVSEVTNRYVEVENSIELSIAMEKFYLAHETFDPSKGNFLTYAKTLMRNGIIDHMRKEKHHESVPIEEELYLEDHGTSVHDQVALKMYEGYLKKFKITFEQLVDQSPVHEITRRNMIQLGKECAGNQRVVEHLYTKKRLPIVLISREYKVSEKVVKSHKKFLIAVIVAFEKQVDMIIQWIS